MLKIAFRNLFRYHKRTTITAISICFGVAFGIFIISLLDGVHNESYRNLMVYETSAIKIFEKGWFEEIESTPIEYLIDSDTANSLEKQLTENNITSYTKEFIENSDVSFYQDPFPSTGSIQAQIHALDLSSPSAYEYTKGNIEGQWISPGSEGAVIGSKLAYDIGADIGYYITVQTKGKGGFLQAFDVPIVGIIATGNPIIDGGTLFFDYGFIDDILELDGSYSSIAMSFGSSSNSNMKETVKMMPTVTTIASNLDLDARAWNEIAADIVALSESDNGGSFFIMFFIFIIAIVGVTNTMVMAISERKNEVAMLRSLGYTPLYIKTLFCLEGGMIGALGSLLGSIIGVIYSIYVQINGLDFTSLLGDLDFGYRVSAVFYTDVSAYNVFLVFIFSVLFCTLAAYLAVHKSINAEIATQLRST